jgi:1-acyl-sn-glycerol-3-phosphate acyltransferase
VELDPGKAVLLLSNHFSWWDGFFLFQINRLLLHKKFYIMIAEENYLNIWFLKFLGAFSVKRSSRSAIETLQYAGELLNVPENLLLIFPQGKLYSNYVEEVSFEKGVLSIINSSNKNFQYLFVSLFVDYFQQRKPTITCYLQKWEAEELASLQLIKNSYNKHYKTSRQQQALINV